MKQRKYRCVIIGCGWIGTKNSEDPLVDNIQSHAKAYDICENTSLVGLCDTNTENLISACHRWPLARGYSDIDAMLKSERPEIISVCTPDETHYAICRQILNAESLKAIIIEKPIATNLKDAEVFLAEVAKRNVAIIVNYSRRFSSSHIAIKNLIDRGEIGEIMAVTGAYSKGIIHNGSHWFDLVRWLVAEIVEIEAWEGVQYPINDPTCHVRVCFETGIYGFLVGIDANKFSIFELDIIGTLGRLRITNTGHQIEFSSVEKSKYYSGYYALGATQLKEAGFNNVALKLIENTIQVVNGGASPLCSGFDAFAALRISETACHSLIKKKSLKIHHQMEV